MRLESPGNVDVQTVADCAKAKSKFDWKIIIEADPALKALATNRKDTLACDFRAHNERNRIELVFNRLKQFRRVATQ